MSEYIYGSIGDPLANVLGEIYLPRAEVVRCRDCKHYGLGRRCGWSKRFVTPDGYCAWAERRTNE